MIPFYGSSLSSYRKPLLLLFIFPYQDKLLFKKKKGWPERQTPSGEVDFCASEGIDGGEAEDVLLAVIVLTAMSLFVSSSPL